MNILFLTTHCRTGGITSYLMTLSRGLARKGHGVWLASSGGDAEPFFNAAGVRTVSLDIRTKSELSPKVFRALGPLRKLVRRENIDVIHAHTRVTQVLAAVTARRTGRPAVSTCHGYFRPRWSRRLFPCWGEAVIAISPPVADHLRDDFHVSPQRVHVIRNGIDLEGFFVPDGPQRAARQAELGTGGGPVVGIIARLSDVKGHDVLIDAMETVRRQFADVRLLIVGEGREEEKLKGRVARRGLEGCVRFFPVSGRTMDFLAAMDVFVMPSRQEGLGLAVMEAQAAGLPAVASRVGGIPDLVEDGVTGLLVAPGDAGALAKALIRLLASPDLRKEMGARARARAEREYDAAAMVEETIKVYGAVLQSKQA